MAFAGLFMRYVKIPYHCSFCQHIMEFVARKRLIVLPILLVVLFILNISLGSVLIPFGDILSILAGNEGNNPVWFDIVWDFRMTKALTCVLAGAALAIGGL